MIVKGANRIMTHGEYKMGGEFLLLIFWGAIAHGGGGFPTRLLDWRTKHNPINLSAPFYFI